MRRVTLTAAVVACLLFLAACGGRVEPPWRLVIATSREGSVYFAYGLGIAREARVHLGADPQVITTAGSVENLRLVDAGKADMAFCSADSVLGGQATAAPVEHVLALARLYENYVHLVVAAGSPIHSLADLRGRTVSTGADSGTQLIAERLLEVAGVAGGKGFGVRHLEVQASAAALQSGRVDAFFFSGGLPTETISDLARATPIRLVELGGYVPQLLHRYGGFYEERTIPASAYGLAGPVRTVGVPNYLVVNAAMPQDRAYAVTRLLFTQKAALATWHPEALHLDRRAAISTYPLRLHPGAIRYYQESKPEN